MPLTAVSMTRAGWAFKCLAERLGLHVADVAGEPVIHLVGQLLAGDRDLFGIDDDQVIAGVHMRGEFGFVLAAQTAREFRAQATEGLAGGINNIPILLDAVGLGADGHGFHDGLQRKSWEIRSGMINAGPGRRKAFNIRVLASAMVEMTAPEARSSASLLALADQCVQCGLCLPHCPTYRLDATEAESPRGRIAYMKALAGGIFAPTRHRRPASGPLPGLPPLRERLPGRRRLWRASDRLPGPPVRADRRVRDRVESGFACSPRRGCLACC